MQSAVERRERREAGRPELWGACALAWRVFWHTTRARSIGFGVGSIPPQAVREYCEGWLGSLRLDEDEMEALLLDVEAMDDRYMEWQEQESKKRDKGRPQRPGAGPIVGPDGRPVTQ